MFDAILPYVSERKVDALLNTLLLHRDAYLKELHFWSEEADFGSPRPTLDRIIGSVLGKDLSKGRSWWVNTTFYLGDGSGSDKEPGEPFLVEIDADEFVIVTRDLDGEEFVEVAEAKGIDRLISMLKRLRASL